jgi:hypothetical protein
MPDVKLHAHGSILGKCTKAARGQASFLVAVITWQEWLTWDELGEKIFDGQATDSIDDQPLATAAEECQPGSRIVGPKSLEAAQIFRADSARVLDLDRVHAPLSIHDEIDFHLGAGVPIEEPMIAR